MPRHSTRHARPVSTGDERTTRKRQTPGTLHVRRRYGAGVLLDGAGALGARRHSGASAASAPRIWLASSAEASQANPSSDVRRPP